MCYGNNEKLIFVCLGHLYGSVCVCVHVQLHLGTRLALRSSSITFHQCCSSECIICVHCTVANSHVCLKKPGMSSAALKITRSTMGAPLVQEQWDVSENHGAFLRKLLGHQSPPKPVAFVFLGVCRMKLTDYRGLVLESNLF